MAEEAKTVASEVLEPNVVEEESVAIIPSSEPTIHDLIYTVRGVQVMLDSDLAMLHQVETSAPSRAAKRSKDRFPEDFRFRITREELEDLRCQIGVLHTFPPICPEQPPDQQKRNKKALRRGL